MRRTPPIFLIVIAAIAGFLLLGAIFGGGGDWRHDNDRITIVNPDNGSVSGTGSSQVTVDGQQVAPGSVVVIDNGRHGPGFFPFFPLFPLLFFGFLIFLFTRRRRFGGNCGDGGRGPGYGPRRWDNRPDGPRPEGPSRYSDSPEHAWFNREASVQPQASPTPSPAPTTQSTSTPQPATDAPADDAPNSESGPAGQS